MKAKEIIELIDFISNSGLDEVNIETQEFKIAVKKSSSLSAPVASNAAPTPATTHLPERSVSIPSPAVEVASARVAEKPNKHVEIKSPMIGTFYLTPNQGAEPFVKEGDTVKVGQTVCIVEAMKLFNEIESEYSGKIVKILVDNASPIEFDQPLFIVDPS
ncbi:MAG: acetyl-CoA carboxylase biotin carboxyl carrier protein [Cyclobacteriaceae bacterium]|nr:acetyl-CoA carboxylase biotin carboxyl carrier protein [Cyclobacteriaceae bacterium]